MHVHRPGLAREIGSPHVLEEGVASQDGAGIAGKGHEQVELPRAKVEPAFRHRRLTSARVDPEGADLDRAPASVRRLGAAQDGLDPGHERTGIERLGHVVVRSELQADDRVDVVVRAVSIRTGVSPRRRSSRQTSNPSRPGSIRSRITRSGSCRA